VVGIDIVLGTADRGACPFLAADGAQAVTIDRLAGAVNNALNGCGTTGAR